MVTRILVLPGDGIGPEVMASALDVLDVVAITEGLHLDITEDVLHGAAWNKYGTFCRPETITNAQQSDAVLVGAVGGPEWDHITIESGPTEQDGLMKLRMELDVFAGLRPAKAWNCLISKTPYRPDLVQGANVMVMREMCGGSFFTPQRGIEDLTDGGQRAFDLNEYTSFEIERFARASFEVARLRKGKIVSVDKSNVVVAGALWREIVGRIGSDEYPDVKLQHFFADNAIYQLGLNPTAFDVIMADNLFGDLISDQTGIIAGSLGILPSACLPGIPKPGESIGPGIYEPVHGSAPDIAGQGIANPIGMILSVAMMLEFGIGHDQVAQKIHAAVALSFESGTLTPDLGGSATTKEVTDLVINNYRGL